MPSFRGAVPRRGRGPLRGVCRRPWWAADVGRIASGGWKGGRCMHDALQLAWILRRGHCLLVSAPLRVKHERLLLRPRIKVGSGGGGVAGRSTRCSTSCRPSRPRSSDVAHGARTSSRRPDGASPAGVCRARRFRFIGEFERMAGSEGAVGSARASILAGVMDGRQCKRGQVCQTRWSCTGRAQAKPRKPIRPSCSEPLC